MGEIVAGCWNCDYCGAAGISYDLRQQIKTGDDIKGNVKGDEIVRLK